MVTIVLKRSGIDGLYELTKESHDLIQAYTSESLKAKNDLTQDYASESFKAMRDSMPASMPDYANEQFKAMRDSMPNCASALFKERNDSALISTVAGLAANTGLSALAQAGNGLMAVPMQDSVRESFKAMRDLTPASMQDSVRESFKAMRDSMPNSASALLKARNGSALISTVAGLAASTSLGESFKEMRDLMPASASALLKARNDSTLDSAFSGLAAGTGLSELFKAKNDSVLGYWGRGEDVVYSTGLAERVFDAYRQEQARALKQVTIEQPEFKSIVNKLEQADIEHYKQLDFEKDARRAQNNIFPNMTIKDVVFVSFPVFNQENKRVELRHAILEFIKRGLIKVAYYPASLKEGASQFFFHLPIEEQVKAVIAVSDFMWILAKPFSGMVGERNSLISLWDSAMDSVEKYPVEQVGLKKSDFIESKTEAAHILELDFAEKKDSKPNKYDEWQRCVDAEYEKNKMQSHSAICMRIHKELGTSHGTLVRHTTNPRKKPSK